MSVRVNANIVPDKIMREHGLNEGGRLQVAATVSVMRHMARYMPFLTGESIHLMQIQTIPKTGKIVLREPQARYLYYGKVMVNEKTGRGPAHIDGIGYRYRKGTKLKASERNITYTTTKNANAGAYWDRRMWAAEGAKIVAELERMMKNGN